jgi:glycosyltransferase involved in cell wall biosynthesis
MNMYKISIITVCLNSGDNLEKTILSVISQTYTNYEYIIIDGKSNDNTVEIIKKYSNFISKWDSKPDKGIYDAMNKGINMASGEWVIMMNAGDIFADNQILEKVYSKKYDKYIKFLYGDYLHRMSNGSLIRRFTSYEKGILNHQSIIYKKELHNEHGMYIVTDRLIISDYLFFIRIPSINVLKLEFPISIYDSHGVSNKGSWAFMQASCANYVFRRKSFSQMLIHIFIKKIKSLIPNSLKDKFKLIFINNEPR